MTDLDNQPVVKKRWHMDDGTFYGLFALGLALIILYMMWDMRNAIDAATNSITLAKCNEILTNQSLKNISISYPMP